jgi:hypothetical protein
MIRASDLCAKMLGCIMGDCDNRSPSTRTIILAIRALYELWCMVFASQPLVLRDTEGRACRKPKISRTKLAINRSGSNTEKRGKQGSPNRAGRLTAAYLINDEGE